MPRLIHHYDAHEARCPPRLLLCTSILRPLFSPVQATPYHSKKPMAPCSFSWGLSFPLVPFQPVPRGGISGFHTFVARFSGNKSGSTWYVVGRLEDLSTKRSQERRAHVTRNVVCSFPRWCIGGKCVNLVLASPTPPSRSDSVALERPKGRRREPFNYAQWAMLAPGFPKSTQSADRNDVKIYRNCTRARPRPPYVGHLCATDNLDMS